MVVELKDIGKVIFWEMIKSRESKKKKTKETIENSIENSQQTKKAIYKTVKSIFELYIIRG